VFHTQVSNLKDTSKDTLTIQHASCIFIPFSHILHQLLTHFRSKRLRSLHTMCHRSSPPSCLLVMESWVGSYLYIL